MELIAFVVGALVAWYLLKKLFSAERIKLNSAEVRFAEHKPIRKEYLKIVACSTDLKLRLDALELKNAFCKMVGYDGSYFKTVHNLVLLNVLRKATARNGRLSYVFVARDQQAIAQNILEAAKVVERENLAIEFWLFDWENASEDAQDIATEFSTKHPTVASSDQGDVLWLEGNHPPGAKHAYGVLFVPPVDMQGDDRVLFDEVDAKVAKLLENSTQFNLNEWTNRDVPQAA
ncbi:MAG: hypothetical protein AAGD04_16345 [Pseudomonadota bacterium]